MPSRQTPAPLEAVPSHEFHVLADSGEDEIAFSDGSEICREHRTGGGPRSGTGPTGSVAEMTLVDTPNTHTIDELVSGFDQPIEKTIKTLVVAATEDSDSDFIALLVRGDHTLNEFKAVKLDQVASPLRFATDEEIRDAIGTGQALWARSSCPFHASQTAASS